MAIVIEAMVSVAYIPRRYGNFLGRGGNKRRPAVFRHEGKELE
jgi:hypothetical protein